MQEKETETGGNQNRHTKRVGRMKNMIVTVLTGWIVLSMILMICLFGLVFHTRSQVKELRAQIEAGLLTETGNESTEEDKVSEIEEGSFYSDRVDYGPAIPEASGISDEENLAEASDTHKVYLTFEDGPSDNTAAILDVLKEKGVKATFFVTGQEDEAAQELYKRIVEEGHTLGMHSYSNKYSQIYQSEESFREDIVRLREYLKEITGIEPIYYRFPGGSGNQITNVPMENFIHYLNQEGLVYYDWNVSSGDSTANAYTNDEMVANVINDVVKYKTSVVLLHDGKDSVFRTETLEAMIEALLAMDAEILPISEETSVIQSVKADTVE